MTARHAARRDGQGVAEILLAVDGGNSKTDVALVARDGTVLGALRGPTVSHQRIGLEGAGRRLRGLVDEVAERAGLPVREPVADAGVLCLAGLDLPSDERALARLHGASGICRDLHLENDTMAGLRAGSRLGWGVGIVVGAGINAVGVAPNGRRARFAGLGSISGDRGGGWGLGMEALGAAVRAQDRRGAHTSLERLVPAHFGLRRPLEVTAALYTEAITHERIGELASVAVAAARGGDEVALALIGWLADECAAFAVASIRRLGLARRQVPVVLSGGVARGAGDLLADAVAIRVRAAAPAATISILRAPPVVGAALLALDRVIPRDVAADERVRRGLTDAALVRVDGVGAIASGRMAAPLG